jgi:RND family efflux transporter MFP subunit
MVVYDLPLTRVVTDFEEFPGAVQPIFNVEVRARVSGYLKRVYFQDGQEVKRGDSLFLIDPRPFQANLDRARASLEQAEARARRLGNEYRRAKVLFDQGRSISREEFDRYAFDHAEAEAAVSTSKANLDLAQLDLDWTNVVADLPEGMTGRLGRRLVDPGNLIKADETLMTTIVTQDPLYVYFDVHEQAMLRIRRLLEQGKLRARSEHEVPVLVGLSDERDAKGEPAYPHAGVVDFTDNRVDLNTGTLRFRARMKNPGMIMTPGMFVKVRLPIGEPHPALMIREQALQSDQGLKKVFVLRARDEADQPYVLKDPVTRRPVLDKAGNPVPGYRPLSVDVGTPGVLRDGFREIAQGVKEGDLVVAKGMQKIRLGINPATKEPFLVQARPWTAADEAPALPVRSETAAGAATGPAQPAGVGKPAAALPAPADRAAGAGSPRPETR